MRVSNSLFLKSSLVFGISTIAALNFTSCAARKSQEQSSQLSTPLKIDWCTAAQGPGYNKVFAFSWTTDESLNSSNLESKLNAKFAFASEYNKDAYRTMDAEMGAGLYVAADPIASSDYGRKLIAIPFVDKMEKKVAKFLDASSSPEAWQALVSAAQVPAILYDFGGIPYVFQNNRAIVVRQSNVLDVSKGKVLDFSKQYSKRWSEIQKPSNLSGSDFESILNTYGGNLGMFQMISEANYVFTSKADRPVSNYGILKALKTELLNPNESLKAKILSLKEKNEMKVGFERLNFIPTVQRLNNDSYRISIYMDDIFDTILAHQYPNTNNLPVYKNDDLTVVEATQFLKLVGSVSSAANPKTFKELGDSLVAEFNSEPAAYKNLSDGLEFAKNWKTELAAKSFQEW